MAGRLGCFPASRGDFQVYIYNLRQDQLLRTWRGLFVDYCLGSGFAG